MGRKNGIDKYNEEIIEEDELEADLSGVIFRDIQCAEEAVAIPKAFVDLNRFSFVPADEYLSGNVREKLATAETFAANHLEYQVNVEYLKRVQPKDLNASEIEVRLGANWIKAEYITDFMERVFKTPGYYIGSSIKATYSEISGAWNISGKSLDFIRTQQFRKILIYLRLKQTLTTRYFTW